MTFPIAVHLEEASHFLSAESAKVEAKSMSMRFSRKAMIKYILSRMKFCEKKGDGFIDLDRRIRMIDT